MEKLYEDFCFFKKTGGRQQTESQHLSITTKKCLPFQDSSIWENNFRNVMCSSNFPTFFAFHTDQLKYPVWFLWRALNLSFTAVDAFWEFLCNRKFRKALFELKSSKRLLSNTLSLLVIYLEFCYSFKQHAETVWYKISDEKRDLIKSFGKSFTLNVSVFGMRFRACNHFSVETEEWKKYSYDILF